MTSVFGGKKTLEFDVYNLDLSPTQDGKSRFRSGRKTTKNVRILIVTGILGGGVDLIYNNLYGQNTTIPKPDFFGRFGGIP